MPPSKILCLHGAGTSAKIWETQLGSLRHHLPDDWEWTFIDGEETCEAAEGVGEVYEGPYRTYYTMPTVEVVDDCHAMLDEVIEDMGPFDVVIGFSQGGALAASYMLHQQQDQPSANRVFSMAIFINASLPYSKSTTNGLDMADLFATYGNTPSAWKSIVPSDDAKLSKDVESYLKVDKAKDPLKQIRRWHPANDKERIAVPTVHVFGLRDPYLPQGQLLKELCQQDSAFEYKHAGGHEVPRAWQTCKEVAAQILHAKARAEMCM